MGGTSKNGSYLKVLNRVRELIEDEFELGGKLPSARELSNRLNVSLETYMKALRELCAEGIAYTTKGRGGTFIRPKNERLEMVGLVFGSGSDSPIIGAIAEQKIMERMLSCNFTLRLISATDVKDIPAKARHHGVRALIWLSPPAQALSVIGKIQEEGRIPIVVSSVFDSSFRKELMRLKYNLVTNDYHYAGKLVTDFCLKRKLSRMFYIGGMPSFEAHGFADFFARSGVILTDAHVCEHTDILPSLGDRFRNLNISVIFSEGGFPTLNRLYPVLMGMEESERPALLLRKSKLPLAEIRSRYPGVRIEGLVSTLYGKLGEHAADMVIECLNRGTPPHLSVVAATEIES